MLTAACVSAGLPAAFPVVGPLVGMYFGTALGVGNVPTDFEQAKTTDEQLYAAFFHAMLHHGVALAPGAYEALFVGLSHTPEVIEAIGVAATLAATAAVATTGA